MVLKNNGKIIFEVFHTHIKNKYICLSENNYNSTCLDNLLLSKKIK